MPALPMLRRATSTPFTNAMKPSLKRVTSWSWLVEAACPAVTANALRT